MQVKKGGEYLYFFFLSFFLSLFCRVCGVWNVSMACRFLPFSFCPPLAVRRAREDTEDSEGSPHPRDSGHREVDPHQPEFLLSPPKTPTLGTQPGQRTGRGMLLPNTPGSESTPQPRILRGASVCPCPGRRGAERRLCRPCGRPTCKWPHGRRPATAKNYFRERKKKKKKKRKVIYVSVSWRKSVALSCSPAGRH